MDRPRRLRRRWRSLPSVIASCTETDRLTLRARNRVKPDHQPIRTAIRFRACENPTISSRLVAVQHESPAHTARPARTTSPAGREVGPHSPAASTSTVEEPARRLLGASARRRSRYPWPGVPSTAIAARRASPAPHPRCQTTARGDDLSVHGQGRAYHSPILGAHGAGPSPAPRWPIVTRTASAIAPAMATSASLPDQAAASSPPPGPRGDRASRPIATRGHHGPTVQRGIHAVLAT